MEYGQNGDIYSDRYLRNILSYWLSNLMREKYHIKVYLEVLQNVREFRLRPMEDKWFFPLLHKIKNKDDDIHK